MPQKAPLKDDFQADDFQEDDFQEDAVAASPSFGQIAKGVLQVEPIKGALKSLGQTFFGGALQIPALREAYGGPPEPTAFRSARDILQPANPQQEMGASVSRAAQFAIPALLTAGSSLPVQMAAGGLGSAAVASGEGESPLGAGVIGAASPAAGALLGKAVPLLRASAQKNVASAINPVGGEKKELARVLPDITERMPFAFTRTGLQRHFESNATRAAEAIDAAIDAKTAEGLRVNMNRASASIGKIWGQLQSAGGAVTPEGQQMIKQLQQVQREMKELGRINAPYTRINASPGPTGLPPVIQQQTVGATVDRLRQLKQTYGDIVAGPGNLFSRNVADASRAAAAKSGFRATQTALADAVPGVNTLNREYTINATPRDILANEEIRKIAGGGGGLARVAELGMAAAGHPGKAMQMEMLRGILNSTGWKLVRANTKTAVANAVSSGNVGQALNLASQAVRELSGN